MAEARHADQTRNAVITLKKKTPRKTKNATLCVMIAPAAAPVSAADAAASAASAAATACADAWPSLRRSLLWCTSFAPRNPGGCLPALKRARTDSCESVHVCGSAQAGKHVSVEA